MRFLPAFVGALLAVTSPALADVTIQPSAFSQPPRYVEDELNTPPGSPTVGLCWLVGGAPTGAWAGHATQIACRRPSDWAFYIHVAGWDVYVEDVALRYVSNGSTWISQPGAGGGDFASTDCTDCTSTGRSMMTAASGAALASTASLGSSDSPQFAGINLGHASDTTLTRSSVGRLAVEGVNIPTISSTDTLTNKALTAPAISAPVITGAVSLSVNAGATLTALTAGTYTPTLTNTLNVNSSVAHQLQYIRVGNVVTVSGDVFVDPTAAAAADTQLGMSLPVASDFLQLWNLGGAANNPGVAQYGGLYADATNNRAVLRFLAADATGRSWTFSFTYLVQ